MHDVRADHFDCLKASRLHERVLLPCKIENRSRTILQPIPCIDSKHAADTRGKDIGTHVLKDFTSALEQRA